MNTPSHIILNLTVLGRQKEASAKYLLPVFIGAILPDLPMFIFYFVERVIFDTPNQIIWREAYFENGWQNFIDCFNSIPFIALVMAVAWKLDHKFLMLVCLSMLLHISFDLPLHHDDGHRHFFPFLQWRFSSPMSYWDPAHYGRIISIIEVLLVCFCSFFMFFRHKQWWCRSAISILVLVQIADLTRAINFYL